MFIEKLGFRRALTDTGLGLLSFAQGWVLGNRHAMARAIKEELGPDAVVKHGVAAPFTAVCAIDGKKGKREIGRM